MSITSPADCHRQHLAVAQFEIGFVGAQAGIGYLITTLNFNLDVPGVFAVLILLSLLGIILHDVVRRIGRRLVFWIRSERTELMT